MSYLCFYVPGLCVCGVWTLASGLLVFFHQSSSVCLSVCPWLDFGLPPHCPQVIWCPWGEMEPFSATLAQDGLVECDQSGKNSLKLNPAHREDRQWAIPLSYHDWLLVRASIIYMDYYIIGLFAWSRSDADRQTQTKRISDVITRTDRRGEKTLGLWVHWNCPLSMSCV